MGGGEREGEREEETESSVMRNLTKSTQFAHDNH